MLLIENMELWKRLEQFEFDSGTPSFGFTDRLSRENGWTQTFTARVVEEYKRFVFLAVVADHPVTPSDQVDQVWHLHLTYTKSYWNQLCGKVLEKPLHHGPTRGGAKESRKFHLWYQKTLDSYTCIFGHAPPTDIWPNATVRFGQDLHFQRLNSKQHWVIRKPRFMGATNNVVLSVLVIISFLASFGAKGNDQANAFVLANGASRGWGFFFFVLFVLLIIFKAVVGNRCPECNQWRALKKTGSTKKDGENEAVSEEWKCKYCDYLEWKDEPTGGCGGCGGCG